MKESEFIELLNLYLDHEISAADAARLEAEVQTNPARRRVYQQYCRMQKACKLVVADFAAEAANVGATDRKVIAFDPNVIATAAQQRSRMNTFYTVGTFAAVAACVAIIFVGRSRQQSVNPVTAAPAEVMAQATPASAAPAVSTPESKDTLVATSAAAPRGLVAVPRKSHTLVNDPLLLTGSAQAEAMLAASSQQANNQLEWINAVQIAPLQQRVAADQFRFDAHPTTLRPEGRALGNRSNATDREGEGQREFVGFGFTR